MKDFDRWNIVKKRINDRNNWPHCRDREIWWCSIGLNIGFEQDGKHALFEKPVLILKVFNQNTIRVVHLTSKHSHDKFGIFIEYSNMRSFVLASQLESLSPKRLTRRISKLDQVQFQAVKQKCIESFH